MAASTARRPPAARSGADKRTTIATRARWAAECSLAFGDTSPFRATFAKGGSRLVVVTGDNATGKSFFVRTLCVRAHAQEVGVRSVSMRGRTFPDFRRSFVFGDETSSSTGDISVHAVRLALRGLETAGPSLVALDEPECGLSEAYAHPLGAFIGTAARSLPRRCAGVLVATHSRALVRGLCAGYGAAPSFVHCSGADKGAGRGGEVAAVRLEEWLEDTPVRSVEELLALHDVALARFRSVAQLLGQSRGAPGPGPKRRGTRAGR